MRSSINRLVLKKCKKSPESDSLFRGLSWRYDHSLSSGAVGTSLTGFGILVGVPLGGTVFSQLNAPGVYFKIGPVDPAFI